MGRSRCRSAWRRQAGSCQRCKVSLLGSRRGKDMADALWSSAGTASHRSGTVVARGAIKIAILRRGTLARPNFRVRGELGCWGCHRGRDLVEESFLHGA